jgi:NAD(P)-dependent dehydrogenase (short-subunit alcohol dehydrogenase family)
MAGQLMEGRAGLVTGAASGIGRASAIRFAQEGAAVVVADLAESREDGEATVQLIRDAGGEAEFVACDVSVASDQDALVARTVERFAGSTSRTTMRAPAAGARSTSCRTRSSTGRWPSCSGGRSSG